MFKTKNLSDILFRKLTKNDGFFIKFARKSTYKSILNIFMKGIDIGVPLFGQVKIDTHIFWLNPTDATMCNRASLRSSVFRSVSRRAARKRVSYKRKLDDDWMTGVHCCWTSGGPVNSTQTTGHAFTRESTVHCGSLWTALKEFTRLWASWKYKFIFCFFPCYIFA